MAILRLIALSLVFCGTASATGEASSPTPGPSIVAVQAAPPNDPPVFGQFAPLAVDVQPNDQALAMLLIGQQTLQKLAGGVGGPLPRVESESPRVPLRAAVVVALGIGLGLGGLRLVRHGRRFAGGLLVAFGSAGVGGVAIANQAAPVRPQQPRPGQVIVIQIGEGDQVRLVLDRASLERLNERARPPEKK